MKVHVADGAAADLLLVTARDADGVLGVFAVRGDDAGVTVEPTPTVDGSRKEATVTFDGRRGVAARHAATRPTRSRARSTGSAVAYVVDGVGAAQRGARARGRVRQGARAVRQADRRRSRPCSTCAPTCCARVELGRAAGYYACWAADDADPRKRTAPRRWRKAFASDAFAQLGGTAIQVFGGIGFTWEHDIHLYYKRLLTLSVALGTADDHLAELATHRHRLTTDADRDIGDRRGRRHSRTRSRQPQVLPPPAPMTPTSGGVAIWRSPASPHICVGAFVQEAVAVQAAGRELAAVRVERQHAVARDARAAVDERAALADPAEARAPRATTS